MWSLKIRTHSLESPRRLSNFCHINAAWTLSNDEKPLSVRNKPSSEFPVYAVLTLRPAVWIPVASLVESPQFIICRCSSAFDFASKLGLSTNIKRRVAHGRSLSSLCLFPSDFITLISCVFFYTYLGGCGTCLHRKLSCDIRKKKSPWFWAFTLVCVRRKWR